LTKSDTCRSTSCTREVWRSALEAQAVAFGGWEISW
jgi:hypothetical protein